MAATVIDISEIRRRGRLGYLCLDAGTSRAATQERALRFADALKRHGWRVELFEPDYPRLLPSAMDRVKGVVSAQYRLISKLRSLRAVYCAAHLASFPTCIAAMVMRVPVIHEVRGTWDDLFCEWPWARRVRPMLVGLERFQWRHAAALIASDDEIAEWAAGEIAGAHVSVISAQSSVRSVRTAPESAPKAQGAAGRWDEPAPSAVAELADALMLAMVDGGPTTRRRTRWTGKGP